MCSNADLQVSVVSLVDNADLFHAHLLRELGFEVRTLSLHSPWDLRALPRAMRVVDELTPDILHTHTKCADVVGAAVALGRRLPLVSTLHMIEAEPTPPERIKRTVAAHARLRVADRVIAVTETQRQWYLEAYPLLAADRVVTISNGVTQSAAPDDDARAELRASLGVSKDSVLAMSVAIMGPGRATTTCWPRRRTYRMSLPSLSHSSETAWSGRSSKGGRGQIPGYAGGCGLPGGAPM